MAQRQARNGTEFLAALGRIQNTSPCIRWSSEFAGQLQEEKRYSPSRQLMLSCSVINKLRTWEQVLKAVQVSHTAQRRVASLVRSVSLSKCRDMAFSTFMRKLFVILTKGRARAKCMHNLTVSIHHHRA